MHVCTGVEVQILGSVSELILQLPMAEILKRFYQSESNTYFSKDEVWMASPVPQQIPERETSASGQGK